MAKSSVIAVLAGLLAVGCGDDDGTTTGGTGMDGGGGGAIPASCTDDGRCVFVFETLTLPRAEGNVIDGFDLDDSGDIVCMNEDFDGDVDNTFALIGPLLAGSGRMLPINDLLSESLVNGDALILIELEGVGGASPTLNLYAGEVPAGGVMTDAEGRILAGQTFTGTLTASAPAMIGETDVNAEGLAGFELRVQIAEPEEAGSSLIGIEDTPIAFSFASDGSVDSGVIGGSIDLPGLLDVVFDLGFEPGSPGIQILRNFADLDTDPEAEGCEALSVALSFTAVDAELTTGG